MNRSSTPRHCRCGTRLARDNSSHQCAACQAKARALVMQPPDVPADFWAVAQMRDALASWHMGRVIAAYRSHPFHGRPISQEVVAGWVNITQAQLSRIETGSPIKDLDKLIQWARLLRIPPQFLWFKLPNEPSVRLQEAGTSPALLIPAQLLVTSPSSSSGLIIAGNGAVPHEDTDASAMQAFRAADKQVGGGHLYATVVKYLHTEVAPRLFGSDQGYDDQLTFNGAAALTEMAGWMAHDAGHDQAAKRHFSRAHYLVQVGGDRQLGAHVLASLSHLAHHLDQPNQAAQFASRGRLTLEDGPPQPELEARLLAMQARGFAALQEHDECVQLLVRAEQALSGKPTEEPSPWISGFDEASLASEVARCMRQMDDLNEAQRQAERIIELRSGNSTRSRAFGQLILATVLIAQGKPDEACAVAQDVLNATQSLGSFLVIEQLLDLKQLLGPHRANKAVAEFLICLDEALRERMWLYQWLSKDGRSQPTGLGEGA